MTLKQLKDDIQRELGKLDDAIEAKVVAMENLNRQQQALTRELNDLLDRQAVNNAYAQLYDFIGTHKKVKLIVGGDDTDEAEPVSYVYDTDSTHSTILFSNTRDGKFQIMFQADNVGTFKDLGNIKKLAAYNSRSSFKHAVKWLIMALKRAEPEIEFYSDEDDEEITA